MNQSPPPQLEGKVAFITGAGMGFGRAFAEALQARGASVAIVDIDGERAEQTANELSREDVRAIGVQCDVADPSSVQRAVDDVVSQLGGIDILINNAARHLKKYNGPFQSLTNDEIRALFDVNVLGIVNCCVACKPSMSSRGGGVIVNMASSAAFAVTSPYGVSKLAVRGLTMAFASEFADDSIRVNGIAPSITPTESVLAEFTDADFERVVSQRQLIRRRGTLDDVTNAVLFLCTDESAFITGETIRVTGGSALGI